MPDRFGGYRARLTLMLAIAATMFAVDQVSKLVTVAVRDEQRLTILSSIDPERYVLNDSPLLGAWWPPLVMALIACVVPYGPFSAAAGLFLGGASGNILDEAVWPGGVPDMIYASWIAENTIWNLADAFQIAAMGFGVLALVVLWPFTAIRRRSRGRDAYAVASTAGSDTTSST